MFKPAIFRSVVLVNSPEPRRSRVGRVAPARSPKLGGLRETLAVLLLCACSAGAQKPAVDAAMKNDEMRAETFEAVLRVTDEHPEYVDELFAATLRHPVTLDRFLQNTAKGLNDNEQLARMAARRLAEEPQGLKRILIANLDAVSDKPVAQAAVADAMNERPQVAAMSIVQREEAVRSLVRALLAETTKNDKARLAFLTAMRENAPTLAQLLANSPDTLGGMLKAMAKAGISNGKDELDALVKALAPNE